MFKDFNLMHSANVTKEYFIRFSDSSTGFKRVNLGGKLLVSLRHMGCKKKLKTSMGDISNFPFNFHKSFAISEVYSFKNTSQNAHPQRVSHVCNKQSQ